VLSVPRVVDVFGFGGTRLANVRRFNWQADVFVRWNNEVIRHRQETGMKAFTDRDGLQVLARLPLGIPVRWEDIDPLDVVVLSTLPIGLARSDGTFVERLYQPPLTVLGVSKVCSDALHGFEAVSYFSRGARRGIVLDRKSVGPRIVSRAQRLGVGLALLLPSGTQILAEPTNQHIRLDELAWLTAETIYEQVADNYSGFAQAFS
jgi:hypothetical protein